MGSILIKHGLVLSMNERIGTISDGAVYIEGDEIVDVGKTSTLLQKYRGETVIDASNMVVLPGLVNTHVHFYQSVLRGSCDTAPLVDWCNKTLFPLCRLMLEESLEGCHDILYYSNLLSCVELIKSGTTTASNMDIFPLLLSPEGDYALCRHPIRAAIESGLREVYAPHMADMWIPDDLIRPRELMIDSLKRLYEEFHGSADGRVRLMVSLSTPFNCSQEMIQEALDFSIRYGIGMQIHLSETMYEVELIRKKYNVYPAEYLGKLGLFSARPFVAVHCVWLTDNEMELLRKHGVGVSYNPESNMKLASGVPPVARLLKMGIKIGIGTDGAASNDNLDMFEEMRSAALLQKSSTGDPSTLSAEEVLRMATIDGARVLGIDKDVGSIEHGKKADIILVNLKAPHLQPVNNVYRLIVYCAKGSDVDTSIINGEIVMRNRQLLKIDEGEIISRINQLAGKIKKVVEL